MESIFEKDSIYILGYSKGKKKEMEKSKDYKDKIKIEDEIIKKKERRKKE